MILCTKNYNFSAKYDRKTSSCPITSACPITKPKVYIIYEPSTKFKFPIHFQDERKNQSFC